VTNKIINLMYASDSVNLIKKLQLWASAKRAGGRVPQNFHT